jgi:AcrR family transcriptional regulator
MENVMKGQEAPTAGRMERKKELTRQKIVDTAMGLFDAQGYDATTMEQIAEEADIAKGTLYNYFPVKEAIINEFMKRTFSGKYEDRVARLAQLPDTRARMGVLFRELIKGIASQKTIFEKYLLYRTRNIISFYPDEEEKGGVSLLGQTIIELGQQSGEIRSDLPQQVLEDLFEFAIIEVIKYFYQQEEMSELDRIIDQCVDMFLNGARQTVEKS